MNIIKTAAKLTLSVEKHNIPELTEFRINTCNRCDRFESEDKTCGVCGCFMDVKTELFSNINPITLGRIEITHCPLGKWMDKHIANAYRIIDNKELLQ